MKNRKIKFLILAVVLVLSLTACTANDSKYRNMKTKVNDKSDSGWLNNSGVDNSIPRNTNNKLNTNLNNGMVRKDTTPIKNTDMENGMWGNNTSMDNGLFRDGTDTNLDNGITNNGMLNGTNPNTNVDYKNLSTRANKIAKRISNLSEVKSASVIINGRTAIVGIDTKDNNSNMDANLKKKVEAAVKAGDKDIDKISITMDPDLNRRLKTMSTNMGNGNVLTNFTSEVEDILRRITTPNR